MRFRSWRDGIDHDAERHRQMAEDASPGIRESLLRIASSYDELAALQERNARREDGGGAR